MDNVTETAYDDFDALLEASSLGAPRVTAAIGITPPDARRRFDHAARHPQPHRDKVETTPATAGPSRVHRLSALRSIKPDPTPAAPTVLSGMHDAGKAAEWFQFIHSASLPVSGLRGEAAASRRPLLTLSPRELLDAALRADLCTEAEADPWATREQGRLLALLAWRSDAPAAPCYRMHELHVRTTLRHAEGCLMVPGLPAFTATCHAAMYQLAVMRSSDEEIREHRRENHSTAKPQKLTIVVRESGAGDLPLIVTDDAADTRRWADDAYTLQDERWLQSRRPPALAALRWLYEDLIVQLDGHMHPALLTNRVEQTKCALAAWAATLNRGSQPHGLFSTDVLNSMRRLSAQPSRRAPEHLLHGCRLRAALAHALRHGLDDNNHGRALEPLWAVATELPLAALELPCPGMSEKQQATLWTPTFGRPRPEDVKEKYTDPAVSRPKQPCPADTPSGARTVETEVITGRLHLGASVVTISVPTRFRYKEADPYAVETMFRQGDLSITWTFARGLLTEGMRAPAGDGDVRVWPSNSARGGARIFIELSPPSGTALVSLPRAFVEDFLDQTASIVPPGAEHTYMSSTLNELESQLNQLAGHFGSAE
jgi:hypothetical protein